jgi:hypothetical protein
MRNHRSLLCAFIFVLSFSISCGAQVRPVSSKELFSSVPSSDRESLRRTFHDFVGYQVAGDWEKVYERLDNQSKTPKERFVEEMRSNSLLRFIPQSVTFIPPQGAWMLTGCGVFRNAQGGDREGKISSVYARKVKDDWRFTPVAVVLVKGQRHNVRPCKVE